MPWFLFSQVWRMRNDYVHSEGSGRKASLACLEFLAAQSTPYKFPLCGLDGFRLLDWLRCSGLLFAQEKCLLIRFLRSAPQLIVVFRQTFLEIGWYDCDGLSKTSALRMSRESTFWNLKSPLSRISWDEATHTHFAWAHSHPKMCWDRA